MARGDAGWSNVACRARGHRCGGGRADHGETQTNPNTAETRPTATPRLNAKQRQILKSLIGRWQLEDAEDELEFRPDGSFLGKSHSVEMTAKYQISPEGKLIIDLGLPVFRKAQPPSEGQIAPNATPTPRTLRVVREVRFEGNKLLLRDSESGQTFRYRRLR